MRLKSYELTEQYAYTQQVYYDYTIKVNYSKPFFFVKKKIRQFINSLIFKAYSELFIWYNNINND